MIVGYSGGGGESESNKGLVGNSQDPKYNAVVGWEQCSCLPQG